MPPVFRNFLAAESRNKKEMSAKKPEKVVLTVIKMEDEGGLNRTPSGETITEIQNYLETFNKEIEVGTDTNNVSNPTVGVKFEHQSSGDVSQNSEQAEDGTYYVDGSGQYYYQTRNSNGEPVMTVVQGLPSSVTDVEHLETRGDDEPSTSEEVQVVGDRSVVLNAGDPYQTVTIVPSQTNQGEVSYVLIVQQPDGKDKQDDQDLTVYDFEDHEDPVPQSAAESQDEEDKTKIIKIIPRKSQTVTQPHMCNYCNYTSPKRYLLSRHMKSHSEERPHKCSVCERGFKTLASLQNHVNTHTGTKPHKCKYCSSAFTTSGELVRHVRYKHTHEKPHKCSICDYASVELSKMRNHMRCHTGERPYQCSHCTYASPDTFKLKRHLRTHTGEKPYECDICHLRFTQSNSLKAHKLIHSAGDKPVYQCELCPATCGRKTDLRIHVQKLHTSDKPLKCRRCGKQFPDRYTYKVHNKSHEGEKCWKCDLCPYASVSQRHLESHMLIHTDQKPYQCEQCDQAFRQKQLLRRHQNLYHNPNYIPPVPKEKTHECPECQRAFRHKGNLIRHMSAHDPESSAQEKALALKIGRQKKVQIIDGQQVEVIPGGSDGSGNEMDRLDDTDVEGSVMAVEGSDGQQYVVLEVIQLQDGEGEESVTVIPGDQSIEQAVAVLNAGRQSLLSPVKNQQITGGRGNMQPTPIPVKSEVIKPDKDDDMDNCFGFDEEIDEEEEEEVEIPSKSDIHILQPASILP